MKDSNETQAVSDIEELPSNVIDIRTWQRKAGPAQPSAKAPRRSRLQLVRYSPTELPAA